MTSLNPQQDQQLPGPALKNDFSLPKTGQVQPRVEFTDNCRPSDSTTSHSKPIPFRRSHSRSQSNPFPPLFNGKTKPDQHDEFLDTADGGNSDLPGLARSFSPSKQDHFGGTQAVPVTQRCMTCGHTNSFPRGKKGFRCGKCTTMNDLEPYNHGRSQHNPSGDSTRPAPDYRPQSKGSSQHHSLQLERVSSSLTST